MGKVLVLLPLSAAGSCSSDLCLFELWVNNQQPVLSQFCPLLSLSAWGAKSENSKSLSCIILQEYGCVCVYVYIPVAGLETLYNTSYKLSHQVVWQLTSKQSNVEIFVKASTNCTALLINTRTLCYMSHCLCWLQEFLKAREKTSKK